MDKHNIWMIGTDRVNVKPLVTMLIYKVPNREVTSLLSYFNCLACYLWLNVPHILTTLVKHVCYVRLNMRPVLTTLVKHKCYSSLNVPHVLTILVKHACYARLNMPYVLTTLVRHA